MKNMKEANYAFIGLLESNENKKGRVNPSQEIKRLRNAYKETKRRVGRRV